MNKTKSSVQLKCCICGSTFGPSDTDSYTLQVYKRGAKNPEAICAHGDCLRRVIPVVGVEIPNQ